MTPRLMERYHKEIIPTMQEKFKINNIMSVPKLEKIVVNMGVGEAINDIKIMEKAVEDLTLITGQKPIVCLSREAISNFKLKKNAPVGCKVTLRRIKMYEFMDRLLNIALPRIRDFNGVSKKSFDKVGNYTLGIREQVIFPEIELDKLSRSQGMDITFVFNRGPKEQTQELLKLFGMPFAHS